MTRPTAPLNWVGEVGNMVAVGVRGTYSIQTVRSDVYGQLYVLQGIGHDDLPLLDLPPFGREYTRIHKAKEAAAEIDQRHAEGLVSGG